MTPWTSVQRNAGQFANKQLFTLSPTPVMVLDCGRRLENLERSRTDRGRTCKHHTERAQVRVRGSAHLHDKALVVAAAALGNELVLQASSLLVELHDGVLATGRQDGALSPYLRR